MFNPIGVSRLTHGSLFVERNLKQKNNNAYVLPIEVTPKKKYMHHLRCTECSTWYTYTQYTQTHTPLFLFSLWWCATMFDSIGVSRLTHDYLFVERNLKQKNNNVYVFAAKRSYTKEEIYVSSTTTRNMTLYDIFTCGVVKFVTKYDLLCCKNVRH
jgi:hypothetical protein